MQPGGGRETPGEHPLRCALRMLKDQLIGEVKDPKPEPEDWDARRRYYRVTQYGRDVARAEARRLARTVDRARESGLGPESDSKARKRKT